MFLVGSNSRSKSKKMIYTDRITRITCQSILLLTSFIALMTCPHSKVEESFNLQASYDLYYYGLTPAWRSFSVHDDASSCYDDVGFDASCPLDGTLPYDHLQYPGGE